MMNIIGFEYGRLYFVDYIEHGITFDDNLFIPKSWYINFYIIIKIQYEIMT